MKRMSKILSLLLALCLVLSVSAFASAEPSGEPSAEESIAGTYTDGTHTLVIAEDLTFTMEKTGLNLEAEEFTMLVTGVFSEDGSFVIDGLYDGEINLIEVASADQLAADEATVAAAFAGGKVADDGLAGTYSDGTHTLVIAEDLTFTMEKTGLNLEAEEFTMLVTGVFAEDGSFVIDGLYDGEINLIEVASADQLAADEATVAAAFAGGKVGGAAGGESKWDSWIAYLKGLVDDTIADIADMVLSELDVAQESDYTGMNDGTVFGVFAFSYDAIPYEEWQG